MSTSKRAAILINTGSPAEPEPSAVAEYLSGFLMDPYIRPLPAFVWYFILHHAIIPKRKFASAEKYRLVWTEDGSPLMHYCNSLAARVEHELALQGEEDVAVRAAMLFGTQTLCQVFRELMIRGVEEIICIPLFPQKARCTTGSVRHAVVKALRRLSWKPKMSFVDQYATEPLYIEGLINSIAQSGFNPQRDHLVASFHSVPSRDIKRGDSYREQVEQTASLLQQGLNLTSEQFSLCYQSPFEDNRRWIDPSTKTVLKQKAASLQSQGEKGDVYLICPGFAVDCLETRYDVFHDLKPCFDAGLKTEEQGSTAHNLHYIDCLNNTPDHVRLFAHLIRKYTI